MEPITVAFVFGIIGMLCILTAFILDEFSRWWRQNSIRYNVLNVVGSALLFYYGWDLGAWPFVILNGVWCAVAIVKLGEVVHASAKRQRKK